MSDDGALGAVDPSAVVREAGVGADYTDETDGAGTDIPGALDDEFECGAEIALAEGKKVEGARMAIDGRTVLKIIVLFDVEVAAPMENILFNPVAIGVAADAATPLVMREGNRGWRPGVRGLNFGVT